MDKTFRIKGESYRVLIEYCDSYLAVSEIGFDYKVIPRLVRIK